MAAQTAARIAADTAAPTALCRTALVARLRTALAHPGFLTGLAALAMLGGGPMPVVSAAESR
jgi:hypothetical protein